ncbi:MAG: hypothetical protein ACFE0I_02365 [Elainellaceae cyanobacterium]
MTIVLCPGIHETSLTQGFIEDLSDTLGHYWIFPVDRYPAYSPFHLFKWLRDRTNSSPAVSLSDPANRPYLRYPSLTFISFSAGSVAAIGAALAWQRYGGGVEALLAMDGWGVPLWGNFPIYRISHDYTTHWSSACLGSGSDSFYADPAVSHLDLWRSPQSALGWWIQPPHPSNNPLHSLIGSCPLTSHVLPHSAQTFTTAANFITTLIERHS